MKKLNQDFEIEKALWEQKLNEAEERNSIIASLESKAADVDMLLELI